MLNRRGLLSLLGLAPAAALPIKAEPVVPKIVYRTSGVWGQGTGPRFLNASEVDGNFYNLDQRLARIERRG